MKIFARQIPPEYQESPLFLGDEFFPDNIILNGNRDYNSHTTPLYDRIIQFYEEAAYYLEELQTDKSGATYRNVTEIINDFFPALEYREKPYSTRDVSRIRKALELYGTRDHYDGVYITAMLEAITGQEWKTGTIRGCCQRDWQDIIYPASYGREWLAAFEAEYFNTGTEWIIHDENTEPETPEDINGFSCYCHGWNDEQIKTEIAEAYGTPGAEVILYKHTGYTKISNWEAV